MTVTFDQARKRWRYSFYRKGQRYFGYCIDPRTNEHAKTKTEAKQIEEAIKVAIRNHPESRAGSPRGYTLEQAFATYLTTLKGRGGFISARDHIAEFLKRPEFRPTKLITDLTDQDILSYIDWARDQNVQIYLGGPSKRTELRPGRELYKTLDRKRSAASINRYLDTLRAVLKLAHKMRDGTGARLMPDLKDVPKLKTKKRKPRPMPLDLAHQAIAVAPPHLAAAIELTTEFGFRGGEVFGLKIKQIDFERQGVHMDGDHVKEGADSFLPATAGTMALLRRLVDQAKAAGQENLILYRDPRTKQLRPMKRPGAAWQRIRRELGLAGRHTFHNIRGTFAQRLVTQGVDPRITKVLMRHSRLEVTELYYEIQDQMRRAAIESIDARLNHAPPANDNAAPPPDEKTGSA